VAEGRGGSKVEMVPLIPMNERDGELFDPSTTLSLRATPPVPGGELSCSAFYAVSSTLVALILLVPLSVQQLQRLVQRTIR